MISPQNNWFNNCERAALPFTTGALNSLGAIHVILNASRSNNYNHD